MADGLGHSCIFFFFFFFFVLGAVGQCLLRHYDTDDVARCLVDK